VYIEEIRRVLVIGAGTMGQQIALQCAMHGYEVCLYDVEAEALPTAMEWVRRYAERLVDEERLTREAADAAVGRVRPTSVPEEAAAEVDILSESVPEDPALKGKVLGQFHRLCPPRTVFTTNTSSLVPSMFARATGRPAKFAALHFHPDVWTSNIVDIMPHPGTSQETLDLLQAFARRIGQIPIVLRKEHSGYVFNTMLGALNGAAIELAATGVASVEDIDRAWMGIMGTPVGPFGILDHVGLQTVWSITDYWARRMPLDGARRRGAAFLKQYVDRGDLGVKTGRGFYSYPNPAYARPGFVSGEGDTEES